MSNTIMILPDTSTRGRDDHLVIKAHLKDGLHVAELFTENGRVISGLAQLGPDGYFGDNWEKCPGALKGENVYHKKSDAEPRNGPSRMVGHEYCSGYHQTVWEKKGSRHMAEGV